MGAITADKNASPQIAAEPGEFQPADDPSSTRAVMSGGRRSWLLLVLVTAGTSLRLYMLGVKSLWPDEAFSVHAARLPWPEFLRTMWWGEANMMLFYVLLRGWIQLGDTAFWLRCLSALLGVAAIPAVYALGSRFLNRKVGIIAAALLSIHSFHIHYSQELRSYSLLTFLLILSSYAFLAVLAAPERKSSWVLWVTFSALSVYAHMFAVLVLLSQWLVLAPRTIKRLGIDRLVSAGAAMATLAAPMAAVPILEHKAQLDWVPPLNLAGIAEVLQDLVGTGANPQGSVRGPILLTLYAATLILALVCFSRARRNRTGEQTTNAPLRLLLSWLVFPIVAMIGISLFKPTLSPRYLVMCVPAAVLLAGWGLVAIEACVPWGRLFSMALFLTIIVLALFGTRDSFASFKTYGHDGRAVTKYILSHQEPEDAAIFYTFSEHYVFEYYLIREKETGRASTGPAVLFPIPLDRASIENRTAPYRRVWLVLHQTRRTPLTDAQTEIVRTAIGTHFHLAEEFEFPGHGTDHGESGVIRVALFVATSPTQNDSR